MMACMSAGSSSTGCDTHLSMLDTFP
jgi:hypothetical protein